jgi:hypothetical protein
VEVAFSYATAGRTGTRECLAPQFDRLYVSFAPTEFFLSDSLLEQPHHTPGGKVNIYIFGGWVAG